MEGEGFSGEQPEGQDAGGEGNSGFYQEYLSNNVPEDYRPHVEPYLREVESNTNERFREHADYRKQWEPYEELGLTEYDPESLEALINFANLVTAEDKQGFQDWWTQAGMANGWFDNDEGDEMDDEYRDPGEFDPDALVSKFTEVLDERVGPLEQATQERQQEEATNQALQTIDQQMSEIEKEHGELSEDVKKRVYKLAYAAFDESDDPVRAGYDEYMKMRSEIESETVNGKLGVPKPPEAAGGPAATSAQAPTSFEEAGRQARERLAQLKTY